MDFLTHEIVTQFYNNEGIEILSPQIYTINQTFNSHSFVIAM